MCTLAHGNARLRQQLANEQNEGKHLAEKINGARGKA